jgi:hypothetical protein
MELPRFLVSGMKSAAWKTEFPGSRTAICFLFFECLKARNSIRFRGFAIFPDWEVYWLVLGTPPPPFGCKILKTNDLFCDSLLDL